MEIIIGGLIILLAIFLLYSNIKKRKLGCDCKNCSSKCSAYRKDSNKTGLK